MKHISATVSTVLLLLVLALPAHATSYGGYVRNWWVQENGDITYYFLDVTNANYITGLCGQGLYTLRIDQSNYDEVYSSIMLAAKNNYKVLMEVTDCSGQTNIIKMVKICTWTGDC